MYPYVSVITAVYNGENTLSRYIDSLLSQTYTNFEALIVDDGSTDSTLSILYEYAKKDNRLKIINAQHAGASSARNIALKNARGKFYAFADADDYVYPFWLKEMVESIGDKDICCTGLRIIQDGIESETHLENKEYTTESLIEEIIIKKCHGYMPIKMIKASIIQDNSIYYDTNLRFREDDVFFAECITHAKSVAICCRSGYLYYINPDPKKYDQRNSACAERFFSLYYNYYKRKFPMFFKRVYSSTIQEEIIYDITNNIKPSKNLIKFYEAMCDGMLSSIKSKIIYLIFCSSRYILPLSKLIVDKLVKR